MRVDLRAYGLEPPEKGKTGRTGQTPPSEVQPGEAVALDQTRFSFDQTRVQKLEAQVMAQPDIREAKVEALRQAIGKGEYAVDDGQVADALISDLAAGSTTRGQG